MYICNYIHICIYIYLNIPINKYKYVYIRIFVCICIFNSTLTFTLPMSQPSNYSLEGVQYGDENDPHAVNHGHKKALGVDIKGDGGSRPRTAPISGVIRR
jgi:hypothetical protein